MTTKKPQGDMFRGFKLSGLTFEAAKCIETAVKSGAHRAVKYVSPNLIVRATQRLTRKKVPGASEDKEILVTIGRPNYREVDMIKDLKKSGVSFPVRNIILQFPPKPKTAKRK